MIRKPIEQDGVVAYYLLRPISNRITQALCHTALTPNQVSVAAIALGVAAGPLAARGTRASHIAAALLLVVNLIVDCVDGDLARLTHRKSRLGEWLDTVGDDLTLAVYMIGLGFGVRSLPIDVDPRAYALAATVLFAATSAYVYYVLVRYVGVIDVARFPHVTGTAATRTGMGGAVAAAVTYALKRDFYITLFLLLAIANLASIALLLLGIGAVANALAVGAVAVQGPRASVEPEAS